MKSRHKNLSRHRIKNIGMIRRLSLDDHTENLPEFKYWRFENQSNITWTVLFFLTQSFFSKEKTDEQ